MQLLNEHALMASVYSKKTGIKIKFGNQVMISENLIEIPVPNDQTKNASRGYLIQSCGKLNKSDRKINTFNSDVEKRIFESLETTRVEMAHLKKYAGDFENLNAMMEIALSKLPKSQEELTNEKVIELFIYLNARFDVSGYDCDDEFWNVITSKFNDIFTRQFAVKLASEIQRIKQCESTQDSLDLARQVISLIEKEISDNEDEEDDDNQQPQSDDQNSNDSEDESDQNGGNSIEASAGESKGGGSSSDSESDDDESANSGNSKSGGSKSGTNDDTDNKEGDESGNSTPEDAGESNNDENSSEKDSTSESNGDEEGENSQSESSSDGSDGSDDEGKEAEDDKDGKPSKASNAHGNSEEKSESLKNFLNSNETDLLESESDSISNELNEERDTSYDPSTINASNETLDLEAGDASNLTDLANASGKTLATAFRRIIEAESRVKRISSKKGRNFHKKAPVKIISGMTNVFETKTDARKINTAVSFCLDSSGSMGQNILLATQSLATAMMALESLRGVQTSAFSFDMQLHRIKQFHEKARVAISKLVSIRLGGGTYTAPSIIAASQDLMVRKENKRIIIALTDGEPHDRHETITAIKHAEMRGMTVIGIGMGKEVSETTMSELFKKSVMVRNFNDLSGEIIKLAKDIL